MVAVREPRAEARSRRGGEALEEIDFAGFERILGTHNPKTFEIDQAFENLRSVAELVDGSADVGADGSVFERLIIGRNAAFEQGFHGRADAVDDRSEVR